MTGDRDILQLVEDDRVLVYMPTKGISEGKIYQSADVVERMGVSPAQIVDLKGLSGDSSDNYPGVPGIGPKTAIDLIRTYHTVEALYEKAEQEQWKEIKASVAEKLKNGKSLAFLSKDLATIRTDVPIIPRVVPIPTLNTEASREALLQFHFHSLLKRMGGSSEAVSQKKADTAPARKGTHPKTPGEQQGLF